MGFNYEKLNITQIKEGISHSIIQDIVGPSEAPTNEQLVYALKKLNLLLPGEQILAYNDIAPWKRGGAETYIAVGQLTVLTGDEIVMRPFIAKAAVTFPTKPSVAVEDWSQRLHLLSSLGVSCPKLYSTYKAILYEEFILDSLDTKWQLATDSEKLNLTGELVKIAGVLDACGFRPISYLCGLRTNSNKVYIVDVGSDISSWNFSTPVSMSYLEWRQSKFLIPQFLPDLDKDYRLQFARVREIIMNASFHFRTRS